MRDVWVRGKAEPVGSKTAYVEFDCLDQTTGAAVSESSITPASDAPETGIAFSLLTALITQGGRMANACYNVGNSTAATSDETRLSLREACAGWDEALVAIRREVGKV